MKSKTGFTLVELLVVIAIITVLAAMLLPTLEKSLELSRRIACANNQRQLYVPMSLYASDSADGLPYYSSNYGGDANQWEFFTGYIYWATGDSPVRSFWSAYCQLPVKRVNYGLFADYRNIAYCPSMRLITTPGDNDFGHNIGYSFPAFGLFHNAAGYGSTHFSALGGTVKSAIGGHPAGPIAVLMDTTFPATHAKWPDRNHNQAGGNVTAGDGSCKWVGMDGFQLSRPLDAGILRPWAYHVQHNYGRVSTGMFSVYFPYVAYPNGMDHQSNYWAPNRRLFGYR